jgi:protein required for attachment to host cells
MVTDNLWIVVAHQSGVRIFRRNRPSAGLELVASYDHPKARMRDNDLVTDRPGRSFTPTVADTSPAPGVVGRSPRRHGFSPPVMPHEVEVLRFARDMAHRLETARAQNKYNKLVLVAGPDEMGILRGALDKKTSDCVIATLTKNLAKVRDIEIEDQIFDVLEEADQKLILQRPA